MMNPDHKRLLIFIWIDLLLIPLSIIGIAIGLLVYFLEPGRISVFALGVITIPLYVLIVWALFPLRRSKRKLEVFVDL